ncbi:SDR family oxidoreductase [Actinoplanes sp. NPDC051859]|uniref:SDR family oxidoreductase n=1 Tax=Actinoplanes sp. NPDC051859 TaxID=3363909 RepID=UPI00378AB818
MIDSSRLVVVSGGGTGIGREIARTQAAEGDRVVVLGRRGELLRGAQVEINDELGAERVFPVEADLTEPAQVRRAVARIAELGAVDTLVTNAGAIITLPASDDLEALTAA